VSVQTAPDPPVRPVRDGVFFTLPEALPRGRHNLKREEVQGAQRQRLIIATTELLAARGYRGFGQADVAKRAGVSLAAFYECFPNKEACIFAGYERFIEVVIARLAAVEADPSVREKLTQDLLGAYLDALQSDPVVARAYQVEIDALGAPARALRRTALGRVAEYLRAITMRRTPAVDLPWTAYLGVVYAHRQLAADALDTEAEPDFAALRAELEIWLTDLFRDRR
jgi:AcrR family transcriptional regulator